MVTLLSVHGPAGVLDLTVPPGATLADVAGAYAHEAGLVAVLPLVTSTGAPLPLTAGVEGAGLVTGSVVVAVDPRSHDAAAGSAAVASHQRGGAASTTWVVVAVTLAAASGWAVRSLSYDARWPAASVLLLAALVAVLPWGPLRAPRALAAPAFAAAACFVLAWDPLPERWPVVTGIAALGAAVGAAAGRAVAPQDGHDAAVDGLDVWIVGGVTWFAVSALGVLGAVAPHVVWSVLFVVAVLAARCVPGLVVDVPDRLLLDLDRLAGWSELEAVARRGARLLDAAAVGTLAVVVVTAPLLVRATDLPWDRAGAFCLVGFGGASLLLAARGHRHAVARSALHIAGVWALALVAADLLGLGADDSVATSGWRGVVAGASVAVGAVLLAVAVPIGRGWRSAWWSRAADVAEACCGAASLGSLVVASGLVEHLWTATG